MTDVRVMRTPVTGETAVLPRMRVHQLIGKTLRLLAGIGVLGLAFAMFAPPVIGGSTSYVVTHGASMLPSFVPNSLVITREQDDYRVGDVVAYHNEQLDAVVLHRIVARDDDRYVFRGDNNDYLDSYHPTESKLIGEEWLYWPAGGKYLLLLRDPAVFGGIIGLVTLFSLVPAAHRPRRRRHRAR